MLGLIKINLKHCHPRLKQQAYITLVRPHLEYCSTVWNPHHQTIKLSTRLKPSRTEQLGLYRIRTSTTTTSVLKVWGQCFKTCIGLHFNPDEKQLLKTCCTKYPTTSLQLTNIINLLFVYQLIATCYGDVSCPNGGTCTNLDVCRCRTGYYPPHCRRKYN